MGRRPSRLCGAFHWPALPLFLLINFLFFFCFCFSSPRFRPFFSLSLYREQQASGKKGANPANFTRFNPPTPVVCPFPRAHRNGAPLRRLGTSALAATIKAVFKTEKKKLGDERTATKKKKEAASDLATRFSRKRRRPPGGQAASSVRMRTRAPRVTFEKERPLRLF